MFEPLENAPPENPSDAFMGERRNPFDEPLPERQGTRAGFPLRHEDQSDLAAPGLPVAETRHFRDEFEAVGASLFESAIPRSFLLQGERFSGHPSPRADLDPMTQAAKAMLRARKRVTDGLFRGQIKDGAWRRVRTTDTRIFNPLLYQLSYPGADAASREAGL